MVSEKKQIIAIDLNADLGEGAPYDEEILACVSSANIACGGHAGDAASMRAAVNSAIRHQVAIGAHPSFIDRANFGRSELHVEAAQLHAMLVAQISALRDIVHQAGARLVHVKPHGALYNQAARDPVLAQIVVNAVTQIDPALRVVGLAGGALIRVARAAGMPVAEEVFADRRYNADQSLVSRTVPGAIITDVQHALHQVMSLVEENRVLSLDGGYIDLRGDTLCLHGDAEHALQLARLIRQNLRDKNIPVRALALPA
jgi:UPF0271 protein